MYVNRKADKVTQQHQRKCNVGRYIVNRNTVERQGTKLAWYYSKVNGQMIRYRNPALVGVS